jgi:hypothetical protein
MLLLLKGVHMPVTASWAGKIASTHSTMTETSAEVANILHAMEVVTKIALGHISHAPGLSKHWCWYFEPYRARKISTRAFLGLIYESYCFSKRIVPS